MGVNDARVVRESRGRRPLTSPPNSSPVGAGRGEPEARGLFLAGEGVGGAAEGGEGEADEDQQVEAGVVAPESDQEAAQEVDRVDEWVEVGEGSHPIRGPVEGKLSAAGEV